MLFRSARFARCGAYVASLRERPSPFQSARPAIAATHLPSRLARYARSSLARVSRARPPPPTSWRALSSVPNVVRPRDNTVQGTSERSERVGWGGRGCGGGPGGMKGRGSLAERGDVSTAASEASEERSESQPASGPRAFWRRRSLSLLHSIASGPRAFWRRRSSIRLQSIPKWPRAFLPFRRLV